MNTKKIQEHTDGILTHEGLERSEAAKEISRRVLQGEITKEQGLKELLEPFQMP